MTWHRCASRDDLWPGVPLPIQIDEKSIALYRLGERVFATSNVCTHEEAWLSEGYVDGDCIECPLHGAIFHIPTGEVRGGPVDKGIETYAVRVDGEEVFVDVDAIGAAGAPIAGSGA